MDEVTARIGKDCASIVSQYLYYRPDYLQELEQQTVILRERLDSHAANYAWHRAWKDKFKIMRVPWEKSQWILLYLPKTDAELNEPPPPGVNPYHPCDRVYDT